MTRVDYLAIRRRWQTFGNLRRLYTNLLPDFDRATIGDSHVLEPLKLRDLSRASSSSRKNKLDQESQTLALFSSQFKRDFHRNLCLLSIALAKQHLGQTAIWHSPEERRNSAIETDAFWVKATEETKVRESCRHDTMQSLEVDDFLFRYLFPMLAKRLLSRVRTLPNGEPLTNYRYLLYPVDLADLVKRKTWKAGNEPRCGQWLLDRRFPWSAAAPLGKTLPFYRPRMVRRLGAIPVGSSVENGNAKILYYNGYRRFSGSPFLKTRKRPVMTRAISVPVLLPRIGRCDEKEGKVDPGRPLV
ncbi:MAG: hypothetical protein Q9174_006225 [Haloplaca sp. 1 TL-2023]